MSDCKTPNDRQYRQQGIELFSTFVTTHAPPVDAHFRRFGDADGFPSTYQVNNLGLSFNAPSPSQAMSSRLRARCAVWEEAVATGQQGRGMIQSYAWVE